MYGASNPCMGRALSFCSAKEEEEWILECCFVMDNHDFHTMLMCFFAVMGWVSFGVKNDGTRSYIVLVLLTHLSCYNITAAHQNCNNHTYIKFHFISASLWICNFIWIVSKRIHRWRRQFIFANLSSVHRLTVKMCDIFSSVFFIIYIIEWMPSFANNFKRAISHIQSHLLTHTATHNVHISFSWTITVHLLLNTCVFAGLFFHALSCIC